MQTEGKPGADDGSFWDGGKDTGGKPGGDGHWEGEGPGGGGKGGLPDDFDSKPEWEPGPGSKE